jgi:cell division protease FtsH
MKDALMKYETIDTTQVDDLMARVEVRPPSDWTEEDSVKAEVNDQPSDIDLSKKDKASDIDLSKEDTASEVDLTKEEKTSEDEKDKD